MAVRSVTAPKLLLVEGQDDHRFFSRLRASADITEDQLDIVPYDGKSNVSRFIRDLPHMVPGFSENVRSLGIVRDADDDPENAFKGVRDALSRAGLPTPARPGEFVGDPLKVGVLILPNPELPGMLEDLCLAAVEDDPAMGCINEYLDCLGSTDVPIKNPAKARFYAFLASRKKPELKLGEATDAGYIPLDSPVFDTAKQFLLSL